VARPADEVLRSYAAAWERGDREAAFSHYAADVVMRLPGRSPEAGAHRGRTAVVACIRRLLERVDGLEVEVEVLDRLTSGERVALLLRERARRGGETLDIRRVNLYRVRDGRIVEIDVFEADQYQVDAFFGSGS
jgi:ketosteroid isomerase-like protein